ncbi:xanthine dehydrogenase family protein molybdopterin-binding subunit [Nocardioides hungaricus]
MGSSADNNAYVGAPISRNEDDRHLHGRGNFLADLHFSGMRDIAFVRSQEAHGRLLEVSAPNLSRENFWIAQDFADVKPIRAANDHPDFQASDYVLLATDKVRFVGEPIAIVIGEDRATAEDMADEVFVNIEPLPAVIDVDAALEDHSVRVHDHWADNRFMHTAAEFGDLDAAASQAAITVTREFRMGRQAGVPLETRGCLAYFDTRLDQLVLYSSTQFPHIIRSALARQLDIEERRVRVVAPDVGGGFGVKNNLNPEEVLVAALAMRTGFPVRWLEDRWEHLVASPHAREHIYRVTGHASADGDLLGIEAEILVDVGAYSVWPWTAAQEAGMASGIIPGPYRLKNYRFRTSSVATNKSPMGPYRGVARPGACFAIERTIDELANSIGMEPKDMRIRNMLRPDEFPYTSVTGKVYDSGDYAMSVKGAARLLSHDKVRARQVELRTDSDPCARRRIGIGYASYTEQTAHGQVEWASRGLPVGFGFESATVAIDPSGSVTIRTGIQSHGQGLETTLAQVAGDVLGVHPSQISVRHGDSETSPYGMGTFASRSMVMAGGATHRAAQKVAEKLKAIAAGLLGCNSSAISLSNGQAFANEKSVGFAEIADAAYLHVDRLPKGLDPVIEYTERYRPSIETGTFSYSTHGAVVEVDTETGEVALIDYGVAEDCGRVINPMIVDGQIIGGVTQGIGTALYEEIPYDANGQPKATTLMDYILPGATEVPPIKIEHQETLSPFTELGIKGMGEGGAIAPPAAIANAVADALLPLRVEINITPMTPERVWCAIQAAQEAAS